MNYKVGAATVLNSNDPADWFERSLRSLFDAAFLQLPNALDPALIEGIHDMRVATRRLRSALRDIELAVGKRPAKHALAGLNTLAHALGSVRDEDVAIEEMDRLLTEPGAEHVRSGIDSLIRNRRVRREAAFNDLCRMLSVNFQQELRHRFETSLELVLIEIGRSRFVDVRRFGSYIARSRLDELRPLLVRLYDPFDRKTLHNARIAAKRLRYSIDMFSEHLGIAAASFSKEIARLQGYLGDAHDRDVWLGDLCKLILTEKRSGREPDGKLEAAKWLIAEFSRSRTKNFRYALSLLSDWDRTEFFLNVEKFLRVRIV
ncbi:MAG: CHAD domain-containing protein [Pyrinomonadaceae bacterium]|nr:CHAD domain-containing protein [Pyrinomonadaceae bacterium]